MTTFQKILIFFAVVAAIFFATMGLGAENVWLFVVALVILFGTVLGVMAVVVRRGTAGREVVTAQVLSVSLPPVGAGIAAPCQMKVLVHLPGRGRVEAKLRDSSVPLTRWPTVGQSFPVEVIGGNPHRRLHIRWDLVEAGLVGAPAAKAASASPSAVPMWEDEQTPIIYSPTPPRQRRAPAAAPPRDPAATPVTTAADAPPAGPPPAAAPTAPTATGHQPPERDIFEHFTDPADAVWEPMQRVPPPPSELPQTVAYVPSSATGEDTNGHDPDGYDPADFETPRLEAITLLDFDPAEVDRSDFDDEPPALSTARDEPGGGQSAFGVPAPRSSAPPASWRAEHEGALPVRDLGGSLRFYRDLLGLTVTASSARHVELEADGLRLVLEEVTDPGHLLPRRGAVHLRVADIDATCATLVRHGVRLIQPPAPVSDYDSPTLWRARLHDPDGHEVELTQLRP